MDRVLIGVRGLGSGPGRAMELRWKRLVADGASMMDVTQTDPNCVPFTWGKYSRCTSQQPTVFILLMCSSHVIVGFAWVSVWVCGLVAGWTQFGPPRLSAGDEPVTGAICRLRYAIYMSIMHSRRYFVIWADIATRHFPTFEEQELPCRSWVSGKWQMVNGKW